MASGNDNNWGLRALGIAAYAVVSVRLYRHFGHRSKKVHHRGSSDIAVSSENENDCSVIELAACDLRDPASGEAYARSAKCTLVGTCHVSSKSQSLVRDTIERIRPQCIAIELCEERRALLRPKPTKALPLTFTDVWRCVWQRGKKDPRDGEKHQNGALQTLLVYLSQFVERRVETKAGTDFIAAFEQAKALRIPLKLVDRTISVTMARATAAMSTFSRIKFLCALGLTMYSVATTPTAATKLKVQFAASVTPSRVRRVDIFDTRCRSTKCSTRGKQTMRQNLCTDGSPSWRRRSLTSATCFLLLRCTICCSSRMSNAMAR